MNASDMSAVVYRFFIVFPPPVFYFPPFGLVLFQFRSLLNGASVRAWSLAGILGVVKPWDCLGRAICWFGPRSSPILWVWNCARFTGLKLGLVSATLCPFFIAMLLLIVPWRWVASRAG